MTKKCEETLSSAVSRLVLVKTTNKIAAIAQHDLSPSKYADAYTESVNEVKKLLRTATVTELMEDHALVEELLQEQEDEKCE